MYQLRPQQIVFEDAIRQAFRSGIKRVVGVAPTGFGKGVCIADMGFKAVERGKEVLIVTDRRQIVRQLTEHCGRVGIHVGVIMADEERDLEAPCQIASIQTLMRRDFYGLREPGFIILDEAHKAVAAYNKLICERFPNTPALGMTATPVGPGGSRLSHFEKVLEPIKNSEVIAAGHLLPVRYIAPFEPDMEGINLKSASQDTIGNRVEECRIMADVFKEWEPYRHMQTMVVLPSRATCNGFLQHCLSRGISAKIVDGTTAQEDRIDTFTEFQASDCQMLLGVDVIREGLDLPIAQCLIDLQPTHQMRVYWQKLGRIKRPHPGQAEAVVIDCAGNLWRHLVHPDQDPPWEEVTNDTTIEDAIAKKAGTKCPKCGSKDIYSIGKRYKCEDCKHEWDMKKPFVCPHCKVGLGPHQRVIGGKCPNCGEKVSGRPMKRIKYADGKLREVPANEIKRRKKCNEDAELATWQRWVNIANNWNHKPENAGKPPKTLDFCRAMFKKDRGHWPRAGMKYVPDNAADWKRTPAAVFPWLAKKDKD